MTVARTVALSILLVALRVSAQEEGPQPPEPTEKEASKKGKLDLDGRVFVRETLGHEGGADWGAQTSIASLRLGLRYHWKILRARLEVELRSSAKLRSAYADLEPGADLAVRAGLFKIPISPLELTSAWVLPVADRGLISGILTDRLQVAGRRVGATLAWTPGAPPWTFKARAGYFQGVDDLGNALDAGAADTFGKVGAVRVELGPFGASGQVRQGRPDMSAPIRTAWAAAVDATLDAGGLRAWLEATFGSSWLVAEPTRMDAFFLEARGVAAWRLGGAKTGALYCEPYLMLGLVDPDRELADDLVLEATGGVNLGMWKRWRLQVELEVWRFGTNVPFGFVASGAMPVDHTAVVTQLGAGF